MPERFSASVAGRHMACHASANLEQAIIGYVAPVEDRSVKNAANDGTNKHKVFAAVQELSNPDYREMVTALNYVADIRATRRFKVLVEQSMKATWLQSEPETTADLVLHTADELHLFDLKSGKIPVEVVGNSQLLYGAVTYGHLAPKAKGVTLHIVQPWAGPNGCQSWYADATTIKHFMDEAIAAEAAILAGDLTFGPSDYCMFCPAYPHARGLKGSEMCPATLQILYPRVVDEAEILSL